MKILVVEDEQKIANALKKGLSQHSYVVDVAYNGTDGLALATTEPYDLLILDIMIPGETDGLGIVKQLRHANNSVPILMLTAKDKVLDKAHGLNSGADDYLVKPFAFIELTARVRALLRRPKESNSTILKYQDIEIDTENMTVQRNGHQISLTNTEYTLLQYMIRNPEKTLSKDTIIKHVWDYDADILPNTVEVYMGYLRKKIDIPFQKPSLIHTRRGFGYYFGVLK
jgi:two-component system, OmpR family, response regulator